VTGANKACVGKIRYQSEAIAVKAANNWNYGGECGHACEPYPCFWCGGWHIGRRMNEPINTLIRERNKNWL
jgi:hypothetical protein